MRSFIIHMSASTARRANAERLRDTLPGGEIVEAVNGRDSVQISDVIVRNGDLFAPHYPFAMRPAEIGVFQSHRKVWQKIVDEDLDYALVSEDDLEIDQARFRKALDLIDSHVTTESYIRLPVKQREKPSHVLAASDGLRLILPRVIGLQCICQVVGRGAAQRLLDVTSEIDRPVDTMLQMHWVTRQPVQALLGSGNREIAGQIGGSTIQTKTRPGEKLEREWKRAVYRAQLLLRPQKP